jgi:hypothetical protein
VFVTRPAAEIHFNHIVETQLPQAIDNAFATVRADVSSSSSIKPVSSTRLGVLIPIDPVSGMDTRSGWGTYSPNDWSVSATQTTS